MTRRFVLVEHRGHFCVEDLHKRVRVEGTCLAKRYPANKGAVMRYRDRLNEEWENRECESGRTDQAIPA